MISLSAEDVYISTALAETKENFAQLKSKAQLKLDDPKTKKYEINDITNRLGACELIIAAAEQMEAIFVAYNKEKLKLDKAHKEKNYAKFRESHTKILKLVRPGLTAITEVKRKKHWYKVVNVIRDGLMRMDSFIRNNIEAGEKFLKQEGKSQKQIDAANKSSNRMKVRWME